MNFQSRAKNASDSDIHVVGSRSSDRHTRLLCAKRLLKNSLSRSVQFTSFERRAHSYTHTHTERETHANGESELGPRNADPNHVPGRMVKLFHCRYVSNQQCAYCTLSGMMHSYTQLLYLNNGGIVCYLFIGITLMCLFCCVRFELDDEINLFLYEPRPLPTCLIIGARKCGTRALLQFLSLHPKLRIVTQELHFFDNDTAYELGLSWYRSQMPLANHSGGVTIEKTPGYFTSLLAPSRVYRLNPKMKLVLIVRNPVVRAISDFTQVVHTKRSKGKLVQTFEQAVFDRDGSVRVAYKPVRNSLYALHLRHWLAYFPIDQIHIADGDRLIEEPIVELRAVERFLNLPPHIGAEQLYFNRTKGFYCYVHPVDGPSCLGNTKGRAHVRVSVEARQKLQEFFQPHNKQFYALINRTFNW